jgi:hypothetical protein
MYTTEATEKKVIREKDKNTMEDTTQLDQSFVGVSLSWGTMKDEDLYNAFISFIGEHDPVKALAIKEEYSHCLDEEGNLLDSYEYPDLLGDISWLINEELFYYLNDIAPENCYFGSSEGDGSDYGFWQNEEEG